MARPSSGANFTISQLQKVLIDRKSTLNHLEKQRKNLLRKINGIDRDIEKVGGAAGDRRSTGRARNDKSLPETLDEVMRASGKPMKIAEITDAVLKTGYRSNSDNFRAIVNQTLIKERKRFAPVNGERGVYQLKK